MQKRVWWTSLILILLAGWYVNNAQIFSPEITGSAVRNRTMRQTTTTQEVSNSGSSDEPSAFMNQDPSFPGVYYAIKRHLSLIKKKVDYYERLLQTGVYPVPKAMICNDLVYLNFYLNAYSFAIGNSFADEQYPISNELLQENNQLGDRIRTIIEKYCGRPGFSYKEWMRVLKYRESYPNQFNNLINTIITEVRRPPENKFIEITPETPVTEPCLPPVQGWDPQSYPYMTFMPPCASQYMDMLVATACGAIVARLGLASITPMATGAAIVQNSGKVITMASYINRLRQLQQAAAAAAITPGMINQAIAEMQANPTQFEQQNNPANQANPAVDCDPPATPGSTPSTDGTSSPPASTTPTRATTIPPCTQAYDFNRVQLMVSDWKGLDNNGGWISGPATEHYVSGDVQIIVPEDMAHAMADDTNNGFGGTLIVSSASQQGVGHISWDPQQIGAGGSAVGAQNLAQTTYIFNGQLVFKASTAAAVTGICKKGAWLSVKFKTKCGTTEHPIYVNFLIKCPSTSPNDPPIVSPPIASQSPPTPGTGGGTGTIPSRDPTTYGPSPPTDCASSAPACTGTCQNLGESCSGSAGGGCICCPSDCVNNCVPPDCNDNDPNTADECVSLGGCPVGCPEKKTCVHNPITHPV